jgi:putative aldouronate transport system permease protein
VRIGSLDLRSNIALAAMALLPAAWLVIYFVLPMLGLVIAFQEYNPRLGVLGSPWVGFRNFEYFFFSTDTAWRITRNTIGLNLIFLAFKTVGGIAVALALYRISSKTLIKLYQTVLFLPFFLSWVAVAYIAYAFLSPNLGLLNAWIEALGGERINWYSDPKLWPAILTFINTWKWLGYHAILFYAALLSLDPSLEEAASMDGARRATIIRAVYLPHLSSVFWVLVLINLGNVFYADLGLFWNVPRNIGILYSTTQVLDTYVYNSFRVTGNIGMASAAGLFQSLVGFAVVIGANALIRRKSPENAIF